MNRVFAVITLALLSVWVTCAQTTIPGGLKITAPSRDSACVYLQDGITGANGTELAGICSPRKVGTSGNHWLPKTDTNRFLLDDKVMASIADYNFYPIAPGGSVAVGSNTVTLAKGSPLGVAGADSNHYIYLSGGTGTAEAVLITGGTCTSGVNTSCTLQFTAANTHSGAWTISSATSGIQEAINAHTPGTIFIPAGTYTNYAQVTFGPTNSFIGPGSTDAVVNYSGPSSSFAFNYISAVAGAPYDVNATTLFKGFKIVAKYAIGVNNPTTPTPPNYQAYVLNVRLEQMELNGIYGSISDTNKWSDVVPTVSELVGYGVGFSCIKCFKWTIDDSIITGFGIGTRIYGDEGEITMSRITFNGSNVMIQGLLGAEPLGNLNTIQTSKIAANYRIGGIWLEDTITTIVRGNYFENYCPSAEFIRSTASYNTLVLNNRIDWPNNASFCQTSAANPTTPIMYFDDYYGIKVTQNVMQLGVGSIYGMEFGYTYWNQAQRVNQYECSNNNIFWPCPTGVEVLTNAATYATKPAAYNGGVDPYLIRHNNVGGGIIQGTSATSLAATWHQSPTTGRWVLNTGTDYVFSFQLQDRISRDFVMQFVGLKIGTGAGAYTAQYLGTGLTTIASGNLNFTATGEVETKNVSMSLPSGEVTTGRIILTVDGSNAEFEEIRLIPDPAAVIPSTGFWSRSGTDLHPTTSGDGISVDYVDAAPTGDTGNYVKSRKFEWVDVNGGSLFFDSRAYVDPGSGYRYLEFRDNAGSPLIQFVRQAPGGIATDYAESYVDLNPDTDDGQSLGSTAKYWSNARVNTVTTDQLTPKSHGNSDIGGTGSHFRTAFIDTHYGTSFKIDTGDGSNFFFEGNVLPWSDAGNHSLGASGSDWFNFYFDGSLIQEGTTRLDSSGNFNGATYYTGGVLTIDSSRQWAPGSFLPSSDGGGDLGSTSFRWVTATVSTSYTIWDGTYTRFSASGGGVIGRNSGGSTMWNISTTGGTMDTLNGYSTNGISGTSTTFNVRRSDDTAGCTITVTGGIVTGGTC